MNRLDVIGTQIASTRTQGDRYRVLPEEQSNFQANGWVHLPNVLSTAELEPLIREFDKFRHGEYPVPGRDFCDMAQGYDAKVTDFAVVNIMLPRKYHPPFANNLYERRAATAAAQLGASHFGSEDKAAISLGIDYDQLLAKRPGATSATFAWHQDLAYWPLTPDPFTVTCWLALEDATAENGCLRFVKGSHLEPTLRRHRPLHNDREKSHTLVAEVNESTDPIVVTPIKAGDVLAFRERVVHGSGGNQSKTSWRRAYVLAFRSLDTIRREREIGFTHSHNDSAAARAAVAAMRPDVAPKV